jgi:hypothetical protein
MLKKISKLKLKRISFTLTQVLSCYNIVNITMEPQ